MSVWCSVLSRECTAALSELFNKKHCPVAAGTEADEAVTVNQNN